MSRIRHCWFAAGVVTLLCVAVAAREWTDSTGKHRTEAEFVELRGQTVLLKKPGGVMISVPLDRLSQADRNFIKQLMTDAPGADGALAAEVSYEKEVRPLIKTHCSRCHGAAKVEGDVDFALVADRDVARKSLTLWRKAAERIESGEMPPKGSVALSAADRTTLVGWMKGVLSTNDPKNRDPGPALLRRLSRAEYNRTIRDLIGIDFDAAKAVGIADESQGHGFANQATVLTLSPALMEKYFAAADQILDRAFTPPSDAATPEQTESSMGEQGGDPPLGRAAKKGTKATLSAQYRCAGRDPKENQLRPHFQIANRSKSAIPLRELTIRYWFTSDGRTESFQHWCDYAKVQASNVSRAVNELKKPVKQADSYLEIGFTGGTVEAGGTTGEIQIRVAKHDWMPFNQADDYSFDASLTKFTDAPRVTLYYSGELVWGTEPGASEGASAPSPKQEAEYATSKIPTPVEISPALLALRDSIFKAESGEGASKRDAAHKIVGAFARKAWRRPVQAAEVETLLGIFDRAAEKGADFSDAVRHVLKAVLVSPHFLLRVEEDLPAHGVETYRRVNDHELAVRLSYFLWSTMPDQELLELADRGKLSDPAELEKQTRRMLADPKARALTNHFGIPWLQLTNLAAARPAQKYFPTFGPSLKEAMYQETVLFFDNLRKQDRSLLELIDADYTFVNEELARHYSISGITGPQMRKVSLKPEHHRGGVLGMGSVLAATSHTYRTSPTLRGKYVLEVILGTPPPPPPANVSVLGDDAEGKQPKTFRESLTRHASVQACAACHSRIDPLGFGLENYDGVGSWRQGDASLLDTTGTLPTGEEFSSPVELKKLLFDRQDRFLRNLSEQMLTYALGRPLEDCDQPTVVEIQARLQKDKRFSTLVLGVVQSFPFQHRRNHK